MEDTDKTNYCRDGDHTQCIEKNYTFCKCDCHIEKLTANKIDWTT
jgi:hypothetical protein